MMAGAVEQCSSSMAGEDPCTPCLSFSDMPEAIVLQVMRLLEATGLAKMCMLDTRMHQLGSQQDLWQRLALARWPGASEHYKGDWQLLYRHRAVLPGSFVTYVDRCHALTTRAAGPSQLRMNSSSLPDMPSPANSPNTSPVKPSVYGFNQRPFCSIPGMLFEQLMQNLFSLCLLHTQVSGSTNIMSSSSSMARIAASSSGTSSSSKPADVALAAEMRLVRENMAWWLSDKPEAVFQFVRRTCDMLHDFDMWGSGFTCWPEAMWRRSAMQFLCDLQLGPEMDVCPSVTDRLVRELQRLDEEIRSVDAEATDLSTRPPKGLPPKHWWYACRGQLAGSAC